MKYLQRQLKCKIYRKHNGKVNIFGALIYFLKQVQMYKNNGSQNLNFLFFDMIHSRWISIRASQITRICA